MRLPGYAILIPETAQPRLGRMQGHAPEGAGQLNDALILGRQRLPVILEDQITGENGLVPFPVRVPAGGFRHGTMLVKMATRCIWQHACDDNEIDVLGELMGGIQGRVISVAAV